MAATLPPTVDDISAVIIANRRSACIARASSFICNAGSDRLVAKHILLFLTSFGFQIVPGRAVVGAIKLGIHTK
jgi:hypothetical protein